MDMPVSAADTLVRDIRISDVHYSDDTNRSCALKEGNTGERVNGKEL